MPVCVGLLFLRSSVAPVLARLSGKDLRGLPLEQKRRAKTVRGCLGAICVLVVVSVCSSPSRVSAQATDSGNADSSKKTSGSQTAGRKPHAKTGATASKTGSKTSTTKTHPASHPAAGENSKSNTSVTAHNSKTRRANSRKKGKATARGQQKIDPERSQAIQEALIREHYLSGKAAGSWNQASEDAMRKYQADHGWQAKTVPDSRALISLGLGPSKDHLLNPESAMTTGPDAFHTASVSSSSQSPVSHSADPGTLVNTNTTSPADPAPAATPASGPQ